MSSKKRFLNRTHASLRGFDYGKPSTEVEDLDACNEICHEDPECMWSLFDATTHTCYKNRATRDSDYVTSFKQPEGFARYEGVNIDGYDLEVVQVVDEAACEQTCGSESKCDLYSYNAKTNTCNLKGFSEWSMGLRVDNTGFPTWYWWMIGGVLLFLVLLIIIIVAAWSKKKKK